MVRAMSLLFLACLCAALFSACNGGAAGASSSSGALVYSGPPSTPPGLIVNPDDPDPGASSSESAAVSSSAEKSVTGVIDSAAMGEFLVELEDGRFLVFRYEGADTSGLKDTRPGSPIIIFYYGDIDGTDTDGITITRMATP